MIPASLVIRPTAAYAVLLLAVVAVATHCGACLSAGVVTRPAAALAAVQSSAAVSIAATCPDGTVRGSGALIDHGRAVTAYHVVDGCDEPLLAVHTADGRTLIGRRGFYLEKADVAEVLILGGYPFPAAPALRARVPEVGDVVCVVTGYPARARLCSGVTSSDGFEIRFASRTEHGNSGSAIYDAAGHLVGVLTQMTLEQPGGVGTLLWRLVP